MDESSTLHGGKRKREGSDIGSGSNKKSSSHKRGWDAWSLSEKDLFFLSVGKFGRNFDSITKEVKTKNYDQVRHFYYRILKKINKLLHIKIDNKDQREVMHALTCFWQLKRGTDNEKDEFTTDFAKSLSSLMGKDQAELTAVSAIVDSATAKKEKAPKKTPNAHIPHLNQLPRLESLPTPPAPQLERRNDIENYVSQFAQFPAAPELRVPEKLSIQLIPRTREIADIISRSAHNPRLQLTLRAKKTVAQMADYLEQKWVLSDEDGVNVSCISGPIRFYPPSKLFPNHPGWTRDPKTVGEIYVELVYPPTLRLEYTWPIEESPEPTGVLNDSGMEDVEEVKIVPDEPSVGVESPKRKAMQVAPVSTPTRFTKLPNADSMSLFEDTSCDGFGTKMNEYAEAACKDFYNNFEMSSDLGFEQTSKQEEKNFKGTSSFKSMLTK